MEKVAAPFPKASFPKARRLLTRADFLNVQEKGAGAGGNHFVVVVHPRPGGPSRLGIVASRKMGNAVSRNRGKRLVREWFRRSCQALSDLDVVVILRTGADELTAAAAARELDATLHRAQKKARRALGAIKVNP